MVFNYLTNEHNNWQHFPVIFLINLIIEIYLKFGKFETFQKPEISFLPKKIIKIQLKFPAPPTQRSNENSRWKALQKLWEVN